MLYWIEPPRFNLFLLMSSGRSRRTIPGWGSPELEPGATVPSSVEPAGVGARRAAPEQDAGVERFVRKPSVKFTFVPIFNLSKAENRHSIAG